MKKIFLLLLVTSSLFAQDKEPPQRKVFFINSRMDGDYFYSRTSQTAPSSIKNVSGKLPVGEKFFSPGNSLVLDYVSAPKGTWEAQLLYRPIRGIDFFKPATELVFYLFVESPSSANDLPRIAIGEGKTVSTFLRVADFIKTFKRNEWIRVEIPLKRFKQTIDVGSISSVIFVQPEVVSRSAHHTVWIDDVELDDKIKDNKTVFLEAPHLHGADAYEKHVELVWEGAATPDEVRYVKIYRSSDSINFKPVGVQTLEMERYVDFVGETGRKYYYKISWVQRNGVETDLSERIAVTTRKMNDEQWLDMVQRAQFRYYWDGAEPNSGLSLENIPGRKNLVALGASGFGMMAIIVGIERNFITREAGIERFDRITRFLEKTDKFHGAFSHFVDGPTAKVEPFFGDRDNGGDLVETSFLVQGLLTAQQYFSGDSEKEKLIRQRIQKIWEGIEWSWYRRGDSNFLTWHWSPDKAWIIDHNLIGWNETMITYLMAIASPTHPVPARMYYSGWASQSPEAQAYRANWGQTKDGEKYTNGKSYYGIPLKVGVSNGGPLFFVHYSYLGPNPKNIRDAYTDYFTNNRNIALINYKYCVDNPENHKGYGPACWGLTASDGPWNYSANEPTPHGDEGKITPTGALASFPYLPEESMAALKNYYHSYGRYLWGEYGFRDAINLDDNWCSEIYMGLNQAPVVVMIENYRTGLIWNLFSRDKDFQRALDQVAVEKP